jgi:hypothetical protein
LAIFLAALGLLVLDDRRQRFAEAVVAARLCCVIVAHERTALASIVALGSGCQREMPRSSICPSRRAASRSSSGGSSGLLILQGGISQSFRFRVVA